MEIQKLTTLDTARIAAEISGLAGSHISEISRDISRTQIIIKFARKAHALKLMLEKRYAYAGIISEIPASMSACFRIIEGFELSSCEQINRDRIMKLALEKKDRLGRVRTIILVFEMIPGRGNILLIDKQGKILETLKRKTKDQYTPPAPLEKPSIFSFDDSHLRKLIEAGGDIAKEIIGLNDRDIANLSPMFDERPEEAGMILAQYVNHAIKPGPAWVVSRDNSVAGFSLVDPELSDGENVVEFESALEMYEYYYENLTIDDQSQSDLDKMRKILETEIAKTKKKISAIEGDLEEADRAIIYKTYGDLILANKDNINRGVETVRLKSLDPGTPGQFDIELDPKKSASVNAASYFKKYKKAASSKKSLTKRLDEAHLHLTELEELKEASFDSEEDLLAGLQNIGLVKQDSRKSARKAPPPRKPYRTFKASCGWEILVGKSNADNDELSLHIARKDDYWFHAWQAAGSHVVLRLPEKSAIPDKQTLLEAASLAAYYSKARGSSKVPVAYTQARYVRKPKKFPPGKVLVEREKQLMVKPADPKDYQFTDDE